MLATEGSLGSLFARADSGAASSFILSDEDFMHAICCLLTAMAEPPEFSIAADATGLSAGCWERTLNLELGRPVGSTVSEVSPFTGPNE